MNVQSETEDEIVDAGQTLSGESESSVEETKKLEKVNSFSSNWLVRQVHERLSINIYAVKDDTLVGTCYW